ncbi:uncharacterized protein LOC133782085 isoform X3 [Humulus lupulus]|uniref:uncharacterized protein LOC133782085 isoform X3 n=1 Tax=Humulus lupulus TaxID=3486 RepID=UPI002B40C948|nr:uncharacterized protein LOC133782085 isoform X3 [Humulus lupulus]
MFVVKGRQGCREGGGPGKGQWLHVDAHYSQASMTSKLSHASMASRSSLQDFFGLWLLLSRNSEEKSCPHRCHQLPLLCHHRPEHVLHFPFCPLYFMFHSMN